MKALGGKWNRTPSREQRPTKKNEKGKTTGRRCVLRNNRFYRRKNCSRWETGRIRGGKRGPHRSIQPGAHRGGKLTTVTRGKNRSRGPKVKKGFQKYWDWVEKTDPRPQLPTRKREKGARKEGQISRGRTRLRWARGEGHKDWGRGGGGRWGLRKEESQGKDGNRESPKKGGTRTDGSCGGKLRSDRGRKGR